MVTCLIAFFDSRSLKALTGTSAAVQRNYSTLKLFTTVQLFIFTSFGKQYRQMLMSLLQAKMQEAKMDGWRRHWIQPADTQMNR